MLGQLYLRAGLDPLRARAYQPALACPRASVDPLSIHRYQVWTAHHKPRQPEPLGVL